MVGVEDGWQNVRLGRRGSGTFARRFGDGLASERGGGGCWETLRDVEGRWERSGGVRRGMEGGRGLGQKGRGEWGGLAEKTSLGVKA